MSAVWQVSGKEKGSRQTKLDSIKLFLCSIDFFSVVVIARLVSFSFNFSKIFECIYYQ